jgi:hypothetical protein
MPARLGGGMRVRAMAQKSRGRRGMTGAHKFRLNAIFSCGFAMSESIGSP